MNQDNRFKRNIYQCAELILIRICIYFIYKYSPLPGFEPQTRRGSEYEADDISMCHRASVLGYRYYLSKFGTEKSAPGPFTESAETMLMTNSFENDSLITGHFCQVFEW